MVAHKQQRPKCPFGTDELEKKKERNDAAKRNDHIHNNPMG